MNRITDLDRVYFYLLIFGPRTLAEIRLWLNWTTYRTNRALAKLQVVGDVRLTKKNTIATRRHSYQGGFRYCGLYEAVTAAEVKARGDCAFLKAIA